MKLLTIILIGIITAPIWIPIVIYKSGIALSKAVLDLMGDWIG